jgi:quinol-cytochrome oxidoreductase complex cytochrome b subunit/coenzyme F420-reducing hydrogenase delta subunit
MIISRTHRLLLLVENKVSQFFKRGENPTYFLGALSFFFFWLLLISGAYLLIFYRLDIDKAYDSIQGLTERQPYWGGVIRSLHRYAADGLMVTMVLHGLRVFLAGQFRYARWLAWVSGVILIGFVWVEGVLGYWMVWDQRAQFIALTTSEFLNALPIFGAEIPRAFLSRESVTNLFFLIIIALHIALPILVLVSLWLHVSRISKPVMSLPRRLMVVIFFIVLLLCLLNPATSTPRADPSQLPIHLPLDWFYLFPYPFFKAFPSGLNWLLLVVGMSLLIAVPWLGHRKAIQPVSVSLRRCNACARCYQDCPYEAISMLPRTDGRSYDQEATIHPELCVSCGICIGSCSTAALALPDYSFRGIRAEIAKRLFHQVSEMTEPPVLVLLCERALPREILQSKRPWINPIVLPCIGTVHPLLIQYALRLSTTGVFIAACPEKDCYYRTGNQWFEERLTGRREPYPKKPIDFSRIQVARFSVIQAEEAIQEMDRFRAGLTTPAFVKRRAGLARWVGAASVLALPALFILLFSGGLSYSFYNKDESLLVVSLKYTASPLYCRELKPEEMESLPPHMRSPVECTRERWPVLLRLDIDDEKRLDGEYQPSGLWSDGPAYVYEKFRVEPGLHTIRLTIKELNKPSEIIRSEPIDFQAGRAVVLNYSY